MTTRCGRLQALGLAILLAIGAGVAWVALVGIGYAIVDAVWPAAQRVNEDLFIQRDGTPVIETTVDNDYQNRTFRTLDGKPVHAQRGDGPSGAFLWGPEKPTHRLASVPWDDRIRRVDQNRPEIGAAWWFVHDGQFRGHAYLVGYDSRSRQKIGYLGRHGFRPDAPPLDEKFPVAGRKMRSFSPFFASENLELDSGEILAPQSLAIRDCHWLLADDGLVRINLKARTAEMVKKSDALLSAHAFNKLASTKTPLAKEFHLLPEIAVRTLDRVRVLDADNGKELVSYSVPEKLRNGDIQWFHISADKVLMMAARGGTELFWFDAAGKMVRHDTVHLKTTPSHVPEIVEEIVFSLLVPSPAAIAGGFAYYPWNESARSGSMDYWPALVKALAAMWPVLLITSGISVVLACLCYRRQRKYGLPWSAAWVVLVLLFGLPAYLGYLAHRGWPARLPCPNCGRPAPRDREACYACGREFPTPPPKNTEVFA